MKKASLLDEFKKYEIDTTSTRTQLKSIVGADGPTVSPTADTLCGANGSPIGTTKDDCSTDNGPIT